MIVEFIDYLRDRLPTVIKCCYFVLGLVVVIDIYVDKHHAHTWMEQYPGFWALFGLLACVLIIIISKWFGQQGIRTREDYYDN